MRKEYYMPISFTDINAKLKQNINKLNLTADQNSIPWLGWVYSKFTIRKAINVLQSNIVKKKIIDHPNINKNVCNSLKNP